MDGLALVFKEVAKEMHTKEVNYLPKFYDKNSECKINSFKEADKPIVKEFKGCPKEGNGGSWSGERGNSNWNPDKDIEPGDKHGTNPEHKTWKEILEKYGIDYIPFKEGEIDLSEVSKGEVEIEDFTLDRDSNFDQADEKLAEQKGCTPEEVEKWRKENRYTWHECKDCKTMQKVPTEVHGNIPHSGGISEVKANENSASK